MIIMIFNQQITSLIAQCRYQNDVDKQIQILHAINSALPKSTRLQMPSLLTNDYVSRALDVIEDRILPHIDTATSNLMAPHYKNSKGKTEARAAISAGSEV